MLFSMTMLHVGAQRINRTFCDVSLSEALKSINESSSRYKISFIYNELEDFRVTANLHRRSVPDAVREVVGFYPMRVIISDSLIVVECTHKTDRHLTGTIIDEADMPVEFANVALLNPADSALIGGGVSNGSGTFVIPYDHPVIIARISYVGYKTIYRLCTKENLGIIKLTPEAQTLADVQVKGRQRVYKATDRGIVVNVKDTPLKRFGSVGEMMKHLPLMMPDGSVAGHGIPEVYINNKKMRDTQELDRLRAENILSAEIITQPGAEYGSGVRSVIILKTVKPEGEGLSGNLSASYRQGKTHYADLNAYFNYRLNNGTDFFAHIFLVNNNNRIDANSFDKLTASSVWNYHRNGAWINRMKYYFVDCGWNKEINEHHSVGITYSGFNYIGSRESRRESDEQTWRDGSLVYGGQSVISTFWKPSMSHSINAYYVGEIGRWGVDFSADYYHADNIADMTGETVGEPSVGSNTVTKNQLLAEKLIIKMSMPRGNLDFGEEVSRVNRTSDFRQSGFSADNHIRQQTTTWSLFANYSLMLGRFGISAGLRWQNERNGYDVNGLKNNDMSPKYSVLIPKVSVTYTGKLWRHILAFSTMRDNPSYAHLSSSVNYRSKYEYDTGNPLLKPCTAYNISWTSSWKWLYGEIIYQYLRNSIRTFQYAYDDVNLPGVMMMDYRNIPRCRTYGITLNASPKIGIWQMNYTTNFYFVDEDNKALGITHNWNGLLSSFMLDNTLTLPHSWLFNLQASFSPYQESGCAQTKASGFVNLRIGKQFLRDKSLSFALVVNDIFHTNYVKMTAYGGINVRTQFKEYRDSRRFGIDISWKFNTTDSRYKGSHAGQSERNRL